MVDTSLFVVELFIVIKYNEIDKSEFEEGTANVIHSNNYNYCIIAYSGFSYDEYKKGTMKLRNFKIICVCEGVALLGMIYLILA